MKQVAIRENKNIELKEFSISDIVGLYTYNIKRDTEIILNLYRELWKETEKTPKISELELFVMDYNYTICYEIAKRNYESQFIEIDTSIAEEYNLSKEEIKNNIIEQWSINLNNEIYFYNSSKIKQSIRNILDKSKSIFIDDGYENPFMSIHFLDKGIDILSGTSQQLLFKDIYKQEFNIHKSTSERGGIVSNLLNFAFDKLEKNNGINNIK